MPKAVTVIVKGSEVGKWTTAPYSHDKGLDIKAIYEVPIYEVKVEPSYSFKAVRFGLVNRNQNPAPKQRRCDAGLGMAQSYNATWVPGYSPHSFQGGIRLGAWRIIPGKGFLIHEGSSDKDKSIGGSLGCIEIVGQLEWNRFLNTIESVGEASCADIGKAKTLLVKIESAAFPSAKLIESS